MIWQILSQLTVLVLLTRYGPTVADPLQPTDTLQLSKTTDQLDLNGLTDVSNKSYGQYSSNPVVSTSCGNYEGSSYSEKDGVKFDEFLGIRYAEPPVGPLRFKNPVPLSSCKKDKQYQATKFCSPCMQAKKTALESSGMLPSEDCLCLNIYRPARCNKGSKKPVAVFIYESYFLEGSAAQPDIRGGYVAHFSDIIVVTMNYRLGAFGFLSSDDKDIPGNQGFFDTVLATKWVKEYIDDFGGDPNSITVAGNGAGATLVNGFMLNPYVPEDLFQSAMLLSPDYNQEDFIDRYPIAFKKSKEVARLVGCGNKGSESSLSLTSDQVECLKKADPESLAEASRSIPIDDGNGICAWNQLLPMIPPGEPTIDERLDKGQFRKGKRVYVGRVPVETYSSFIGLAAETISDAEEFIENEMRPIIRDKSRENIEWIIDYYLKGINPSDSFEIGKQTTLALNDVCYGCPLFDLNQHLSKFNELYGRYYLYVASCDKDSKKRKYGAYHRDEIPIDFGAPLREKEKYSDYDRDVSLEMMSILSDFVYGRKMKWPPISGSSSPVAFLEGDAKRNYVEETSFEELCSRIDA